MTIKKTSRLAKSVIDKAVNLTRFSLDNGFSGQPTEKADLSGRLSGDGSKLIRGSNGAYTLQVHSNLWYEFEANA